MGNSTESTSTNRQADCHFGDVVVLGLGTTGRDVARYLAGRARSVSVYGGAASHDGPAARELRALGVRVVVGTEQIEGSYDVAVVSPGIPEHARFFASARAHAAEVIGEPELAWRVSPECWVAITGTNGKTTVTTLVRDLLRAGGLSAEAVGNIGTSAISAVESRGERTWFVAELSSYQLATTRRLHPRVATLLNVTPDHLSWHATMQRYAAAKERAFANLAAGDLAVVSSGDAWCRAVAQRVSSRGVRTCLVSPCGDPKTPDAAFVDGGILTVRACGVAHRLLSETDLGIKGAHNVQNALAAAACAIHLGVADAALARALAHATALEHRIEPCGIVGGVSYVNDSKATNTDAVLAALAACAPASTILLLGGTDKGTDLADLARAAARCHAVVCYGEAGPRMAAAVEGAMQGAGAARVVRAAHLADALDAAGGLARPGDTVLLSPACASFDEFASFEERGRTFKALVAARAAFVGEVS